MAALARRDPTIRVLDYPVLQETGSAVQHAPSAVRRRARAARVRPRARSRANRAAPRSPGTRTPASGPVAPDSPFALARTAPTDVRAADSLFDAAGWTRARGRRARARRQAACGRDCSPSEAATKRWNSSCRPTWRSAGCAWRSGWWSSAPSSPARARIPRRSTCCSRASPATFRSPTWRDVRRPPARQRAGLHGLSHGAPRLPVRADAARGHRVKRRSLAWHEVQAELARDVPAAWLYHSRGLQGIARRMQRRAHGPARRTRVARAAGRWPRAGGSLIVLLLEDGASPSGGPPPASADRWPCWRTPSPPISDAVMDRELYVPGEKALLSRAGGRCEADGASARIRPVLARRTPMPAVPAGLHRHASPSLVGLLVPAVAGGAWRARGVAARAARRGAARRARPRDRPPLLRDVRRLSEPRQRARAVAALLQHVSRVDLAAPALRDGRPARDGRRSRHGGRGARTHRACRVRR